MEEIPHDSGNESKVRFVHGKWEIRAEESVRFPGSGLAVGGHGEVISVENQVYELLHGRLVHSLLRG